MGKIIVIVTVVSVVLLILVLTSWVRFTFIYDTSIKIYLNFLFIRFSPLYIKNKKIKLSDYSVRALRKKRALYKKSQEKFSQKAALKEAKARKREVKNIRNMLRYLLRITLVLIKKFNRCLRVDIKCFIINVAAGDAAQTALTYGAISQLTSYFMALLEQYYKINYKKGCKIGVKADFLGNSWSADLNIVLRVRLYHILSLAFRAFIAYSDRS